MDPSLRLGGGNPLDPMHSRFATEQSIRVGTANRDDCLLHSAQGPIADRQWLHPEAVSFGEPGIHAQEVRGKEGRFITAGPGPDLDDRITVFQGIARNQQLSQLALQGSDLARQAIDVRLHQRGHLGIRLTGQTPSLLQFVFEAVQSLGGTDDGGEPGVLSAQGGEAV